MLQRLPFGNIGKMNNTVDRILQLIGEIIKSRNATSAEEKPRDILQLLLDASETKDEQSAETFHPMSHAEMVISTIC